LALRKNPRSPSAYYYPMVMVADPRTVVMSAVADMLMVLLMYPLAAVHVYVSADLEMVMDLVMLGWSDVAGKMYVTDVKVC